MKFCSYLCHAINFEPDAVQPCCNVHALSVPRFPFVGGWLDMKAYARHIQRVASLLQAGGDLCRNCPDLKCLSPSEGGQEQLLFTSVSINMHRHLCNCRCVYCDLWRGQGTGYAIVPVLQSLAEQHVLSEDCYMSWGGGESSLLPDFEEASRWILSNGWLQYVHTNALRFSPAVALLLQEGRGAVNISLDSASAAMYRHVKGVDGFGRVKANVRRYLATARETGLVHLKYIIFEQNNSLEELEAFFDLCRSLGISSVQFSLNFEELNAAGPSSQSLLGAAYFQYKAAELGMQCTPFFISGHWLAAIEEERKRRFAC